MAAQSTTAYAVIIVNYGEPSLVAGNIGADVDADEGALVVLVDNFHSSDSREQAEALCLERGWMFVASANDGFGAGVNRGAAAAREQGHRAFITLNPDAVASADVLRELARHVTADPLALVSPFMDTGDGHPHFRGAGVHRRTGQMRSGWSEHDHDQEWGNWLSGACLAFSARALDLLGGFSEDFFLYWEDVDISRRAVERGMRLEIRPDLLVVHDEGGTQDAGSDRTKSPTYYFYNIRNRMLFGRRHVRGRDWARWVLASPRQSALIWMRGGRKQAFTEPRGLLAAGRGLLAGAAQLVRRPPSSPPRPTQHLPPLAERHRPLSGPLRITVAIPSYRRPEQLAALLAALPDRIAETQDAVVDVLVIDNDPDGSARAAVDGTPLDLRYVREKSPGISAVRNRALDEGRHSDLLAFLDDDEIPLAGWLTSLIEVWREHRTSAVAGRVISVFYEDTDPWVIASGTFRRPQRPTGTFLLTAAAGNLMLDMHQIQQLGVRFEESLGLSGGEDTLFTRQLVELGGTIVWCNESAAEDYVVSSRLTREWATQRAFSAGNGLVHVNLRLAPSPTRRLALRGRYLVGGTARITAGFARHRYGRARQHLRHDARGMRTFHRGRGMLAGARGHLYEEYARS
ncbi:glycosyltransferase family 2 protein [Brachybacterium fresconis]|uniref:GT2 family glycosyltransferase n=1 Tax=Brachybacterium fresconis TaxID=173363 RepID=A0ABS4YME9_9MICO|nr:GT2 family glycosyltransferase [Brachybacterium fresconis]